MFQDVLLFELFQQTLPNPFLFSFINQLRNVPAKTYTSVQKHIALAQRSGGQYDIFLSSQQPISVRHELKTRSAI